MLCACGNKDLENVSTRIFANGKRVLVGGDNPNLGTAIALKDSKYMGGYYNNMKVIYEAFYHCSICGEHNNKRIIRL